MPIPSVTDFEDAKVDVDDLEAIVNGDSTVTTRLGGDKLSVSQALSQIIVGQVTVYSAATTYTAIEEWVEFSGAIYRPLPSQLPIGPEAFNASKWAVVQGVIADGVPNETSSAALISSSAYSASPANTVVEVLGFSQSGDGGAAQWRKTGVTGLTPSQTPEQLNEKKLTDANGHEWELLLDDDGSFGAEQVGGFAIAAVIIANGGGYLKVSESVTLTTNIFQSSSGSIRIECAPDVVIDAQPGFPAAALIQYGGGGVSEKFEWYGGKLDGTNVPNSGAGQANDLLSVNNFNAIIIYDVECDGNGGSDSGIFTANYDFCYINKCRFKNLPDAGVYTSGPSDGSGRGTCHIDNCHSEDCDTSGFTAKRFLEKFIATGNTVTNCADGISSTEADGIAPARNVTWTGNIIKRCTNGLLARMVTSGAITGNEIYELGRDGGLSSGAGVLLQGASNVTICGNSVDGWNPDNGASAANFDGYKLEERVFDSTTYYSTFNSITGGCVKGIGKVVRENGTLNERNIYGPITADTISGGKYTLGSSLSVVSTSNITGALWEWSNSEGRIAAIQPTTTDDETYLILRVDESGGAVNKRVKQGAANSGPGGVGRALYVDN